MIKMEDVVTSDAANFPPASSLESRLICRICQKQFSRYTCPRCNVRYCSLPCYKRHSTHCTESFMRENVIDEMQQTRAEDESRLKMLEILKRFHLEEEMEGEEDEEAIISEETVQKVLSGDGLRLEDLSGEEIKNFQRAVMSGELSKMIEPWTPWWRKPSSRTIALGQEGSRLVIPLHEHEEIKPGSPENLYDIPPGPESPLQPLGCLTSVEPSPHLPFHLVNVLYGYCFTLRLYNGDWQCDPPGAADVVLGVSNVLGEDARPETVAGSLTACLEQTCSANYSQAGGLRFGILLVDDVMFLLSLGTDVIICLLCDLQRLVQAATGMLKRGRKNVEVGRKLKAAERKVYFLMCWAREQPAEAWSPLASVVGVEKASLSASGGFKTPKPGNKENIQQARVLIEEI